MTGGRAEVDPPGRPGRERPARATAGAARQAMWAVVPAAGRGTRMRSAEAGAPKALLDLEGRPLLDRLLEQLAPAVGRACVVVSRIDDGIREALGPRRHGIELRYAVQAEPLGVAHALLAAEPILGEAGAFAAVMGDVYYDASLAPALERWRRSGAPGGVLVEPVRGRPLGPIGLVEVRNERVHRIEKAAWRGQSELRVAGAFVFPRAAFEAVRRVEASDTGERELEVVVRSLMARGIEFAAIPYRGWRRNVNSPADLREVRARLGRPGAG